MAAERDAVTRAAGAEAVTGDAPDAGTDLAAASGAVPLPGGYRLHRVRWPATAGRHPYGGGTAADPPAHTEHPRPDAATHPQPDPPTAGANGRTLVMDVLAAGVGPAAAAAGTATALTAAAAAGGPYDLVVSAGIAGGFLPPPEAGGTPVAVVATAVVAADLGAQTPAGFVPVTGLGFGTVEHHPPRALVRAVAAATGAVAGPVLTVSTVTGTAEHAAKLIARYPDAVAEAMEGFGVAEAAAAHGVPVLEVRTVSNAVGPRDRAAWRIPEALRALTAAFEKMVPVLVDPDARPESLERT